MSRNDFSLFTVSFAAALAIFFGLTNEPWVNLGLLLVFCAVLLTMLAHMGAWPYWQKAAHVGLVFALAFGWAQFTTWAQQRGTGQLHIGANEQEISGTIIWSEPRGRGSQIDISLKDATGRAFALRLYGKRDMAARLKPGCTAQLGVNLAPLAKPSVIGGYDPRFSAWFNGRRGQGFVRRIAAVECAGQVNLKHRVARLRLQLAAHYRGLMSPETGPVAAALVTGVRGAIEKPVRDAFRHSGLAHMLAISGLHMALFAGSVYALLRYGAALWPWLVLRFDVRKPSAVLALLAATAYLTISGGSFATQRAFIMLAIFFLALLLDRPAITMRNVLWAALLVLILQPYAIMQVGFQMSFAAVMALVGGYEAWQRRDRFYVRLADMTPKRRMASYGWRYASALFFTSLIAGTVTGLIAIMHFYRIGTFGLPANLLAMPLFGTLIMPMAPLSLLAYPFGMDAPFIALMDVGIWAIIGMAQWLTAFDGAVRHFGASPGWFLPVMGGGFVFVTLSHGRRRLLGVIPILIGLAFIGRAETPLAHFIGRDLIIVTDSAGALHVMRNRGRDYEAGRVFVYHGQPLSPDLDCAKGCGVLGHDRRIVAYLASPRRLDVACRNSDVVILPFATATSACAALLIDETQLQRDAPMQIIVDGRDLRIKKAANGRLWHQE